MKSIVRKENGRLEVVVNTKNEIIIEQHASGLWNAFGPATQGASPIYIGGARNELAVIDVNDSDVPSDIAMEVYFVNQSGKFKKSGEPKVEPEPKPEPEPKGKVK